MEQKEKKRVSNIKDLEFVLRNILRRSITAGVSGSFEQFDQPQSSAVSVDKLLKDQLCFFSECLAEGPMVSDTS